MEGDRREADRAVAIQGGRFSLQVDDDQARFNLNSIGAGNLVAEARLARVLEALGLPMDLLNPIVAYVRVSGSVATLDELLIVGLGQAPISKLPRARAPAMGLCCFTFDPKKTC